MSDDKTRNAITENLRGLKADIDNEDDPRFAVLAKAGNALADMISAVPGVDPYSAAAAIHEMVTIDMTARVRRIEDTDPISALDSVLNAAPSALAQMYAAAVLLGV